MRNETDKLTLAEIRLSGLCSSCKEPKDGEHHAACIRRKINVGASLIMSYNPIRQKLTCQLHSGVGSMTYRCSYEDYNHINKAWRSLLTYDAIKNNATITGINWE